MPRNRRHAGWRRNKSCGHFIPATSARPRNLPKDRATCAKTSPIPPPQAAHSPTRGVETKQELRPLYPHTVFQLQFPLHPSQNRRPGGRVGDCAAARCALIPRKEHYRQGSASIPLTSRATCAKTSQIPPPQAAHSPTRGVETKQELRPLYPRPVLEPLVPPHPSQNRRPEGCAGDCAAARCALIPRKEHYRQDSASIPLTIRATCAKTNQIPPPQAAHSPTRGVATKR